MLEPSQNRSVAEHREARQLRSALAGGDRTTIDALLADPPSSGESLQLVGEGLLVAVMEGRAPADVLRRWIVALRERDWLGDEELADQLEARSGGGVIPMLRPLTVSLEDVSRVLEGDPLEGGGVIDLGTGEVWPHAVLDNGLYPDGVESEDMDDPERWLSVHCAGSRAAYQDMESFIAGLDDEFAVRILSRSIQGRGAFRRFKDELADWPGLLERWFAFSDERQTGRARAWLAEHGYAAVPR